MKEDNAKIKENFKDIDKKLIVLSNKGGVGKSTVSLNLANYFVGRGYMTGLFDADLHGPMAVKALGLENAEVKTDGEKIIPLQRNNLKVISMASFIKSPDTPLIWRGPMKMKAIKQFVADVEWGKLDFMIADCPPGTGDEPLSVIQLFDNIDGAIIVTTPQEIALLDSIKAVNFIKEMDVPILGIIENMSGFICPHCNKKTDIFKAGGGKKAAARLDVGYLGKIPLDTKLVETMDRGRNLLSRFPGSPAAEAFNNIGKIVEESFTEDE